MRMAEEEKSKLTEAEQLQEAPVKVTSKPRQVLDGRGSYIDNLYTGSIVHRRDGSLLTSKGWCSEDRGMTWRNSGPLVAEKGISPMGLIRLPSGELGLYFARNWDMPSACGNDTNNWYFVRSSDEGKTWKDEVIIALPGLTMGLENTMFSLKDGRLILITYSQFLSSMSLWGASWGTYKGFRVKTETEGHFGQMEVVRVYYSDDEGRSWHPNDGWILGYRGGYEKWVDSYVEAAGVELGDGRILLMGRSLVGRIYQCFSTDRGEHFGYAEPTPLITSDSPGILKRLPTGDLLFVWNQISREENRRGLRRSRLSSVISQDDGKTWKHFKNIFAISCLADRNHIPEDPIMTPVAGDDDVGELPDDYEMWHYPVVNVVDDRVFVSFWHHAYGLKTIDKADGVYQEGVTGAIEVRGGKTVEVKGGGDTVILPVSWFYER